jgi:uncharacterized protein YjbI with pentapeptide repeats
MAPTYKLKVKVLLIFHLLILCHIFQIFYPNCYLKAEESSDAVSPRDLSSQKIEAEIAKLQAEIKSLQLANENAKSGVRNVIVLIGSLGGFLGALFGALISLIIFILGTKISDSVNQAQMAKLEKEEAKLAQEEAKLAQEKEFGREQQNLALFRSLGEENSRIQLAAAAVLLQRLKEFSVKKKASSLKPEEERELPTIIQVLVAVTKEEQSDPALIKLIADNLVTCLGAIVESGQDPPKERPSPLKIIDFQKSRLPNVWWKRIDIRGLDFFKVDFRDAGLAEAFCHSTVFFGAELTKCVLRKADLRNANFREANLEGAILEGANLRGANFMHAKLTGAKLSEAQFNADTIWPAGFDPLAKGAILADDTVQKL